jgi:hypothetical protein
MPAWIARQTAFLLLENMLETKKLHRLPKVGTSHALANQPHINCWFITQ